MYGNNRGRKKEEDESGERRKEPHPDTQNNMNYFNSIMKKCEWSKYLPFDDEPEIKIEIGKMWEAPMFVFFVYGPGPQGPVPEHEYEGRIAQRKGVFHVSFQEENQKFKENLCRILNILHEQGKVIRKDSIKTQMTYEDLWKN
jgi:hypothetical protein